MEFLITTIVAVILLVDVVSSCPSVCNCNIKYQSEARCEGRGLDSVPTGVPNNTYIFYMNSNQNTSIQAGAFNNLTSLTLLRLSFNQITSIPTGIFNNLANLNYLFLENNQITSIQSGTFNGLPSLTHLFLNNNQITSIQSGTFNDLPSLTYLHLHINQITSIQSGTFNNLSSLIELVLVNNQITSIQTDTFNDLPSLTSLYLYCNNITSIKSNTFNNLPNLNLLELRDNPISFVSEHAFQNLPQLPLLEFDMHCGDCHTIPFWRRLKGNQTFSKYVTCNDYDGKNLSTLQPNDFTGCFMDPCYSNPCLSNGLCTNDGNGSALCSCHGDWTGSQCELSPCSTVVCNDEECYYNESGIVKCFNQAEKYGQVDPCYSNPCLNNGLCTNDGNGSALCSCHGDWTGSQCELSPCSTVECNDEECYYNESGIAKCFNQAEKYGQVTSQSGAQSTTDHTLNIIYAVIGTFSVTTLVCAIVFLAILRYRRGKADGDTNRQNGQNTSGYRNDAFTNDYVNIGNNNAQSHYEATIQSAQEQPYDVI